jgi:hypothetical protein
MSLALVFLALFFILGVSLSPLAVAVAVNAFADGLGKRIGRWAIGLGLTSIYRPAITFNASDELTLKKRSYDEKHDAEYITFGGLLSTVKRHLHDPQNRMHAFYGVPFGFVDELFGVVVDPRDCDLGRSLRRAQANSQYEHRVEEDGRLVESVRAVFERPEGHVGVRLPDVTTLVGGSFDAQIVERIREYYRESQAPRTSTTAFKQLLVPVAAFIGVVLIGMFAAGQTGGGGGGGAISSPSGNSSTINVGVLLLAISTRRVREVLARRNWRNVAVSTVAVGLATGVAGGLYLAFPMPTPVLGIPLPLGVWAVVALAVGAVIPPFVAAWLGRSLGPLGMALGKLYLIIGLLGFSRPVIDLDDGEYRVVEYGVHEWPVEPKWYRFAMTRIGVAYHNVEDNWPQGTTLTRGEVRAMADGGEARFSPSGHVSTDQIKVGGIKGFLPAKDDLDGDSIHVRTDRTTGWLLEAGQDALEAAKEDFGGGSKPVGEKWILGATLAAIAMGALFNWVVFF